LALLNVPFEIALLADEDGVDTVYFKNNDTSISSGNSVYKENNPNNEVWSGFQPVNLQTRTIDSLVQKHGLGKVEFLKLDLQGSELRALKGAQSTLADVEVVQTEFHMVNYNEGAPKMLELYSLLDSMGFALYDMGEVQEFHVTADVPVNGGEGRKTLIKKLGVDIVFVRKTSHLWEKECTLFPKPLHLSDDSR
jgi:FkbM family methyltransferase